MQEPGFEVQTNNDGVSGIYSPRPLETPVGRLVGAGLDGIAAASELERTAQVKALHSGEIASIHSWELVTAVDGPGTRLTIFFAGCPLHCLYCHNPDTMQMRRGKLVPTDELVKRTLRYRGIFSRTNGGVTLSGGEPLMQPHAVARILEEAKAHGVHTAIDTSGYLGWRCTDEMLENLDLCLLDIKSGDEETYKKVTGQTLKPTLEFAKRLDDAGIEVWVRFVLVPDLTDAPENIERVAQIASSIGTCTRVEVLPFHQMGRDKWAELGMRYDLENTVAPSTEDVERAKSIFRNHGLTAY